MFDKIKLQKEGQMIEIKQISKEEKIKVNVIKDPFLKLLLARENKVRTPKICQDRGEHGLVYEKDTEMMHCDDCDVFIYRSGWAE